MNYLKDFDDRPMTTLSDSTEDIDMTFSLDYSQIVDLDGLDDWTKDKMTI